PARYGDGETASPPRPAHETPGPQPLTRPRPPAPRPQCYAPWRSRSRTTARPRVDATACPATSSPSGPSAPSSRQQADPSPPRFIEVLRRPGESAQYTSFDYTQTL